MNSSPTLDPVCYQNVPVSAVSGTSSRGQSETVGVILLTAVVVILVGGFSLVYLGALDVGGGDGPVVDANIEATGENVTITHHGGASVPYADFDVVLRRGDTSERYSLSEWAEADDDTFDPSDRVRGDHAMGSGQLTVLLVHTASNTVVEEAYLDARDEQEDEEDGTDSVRAAFTPNTTEPEPGEAVAFDASESTGEGGIASYEWDWNGTARSTTAAKRSPIRSRTRERTPSRSR